MLLYALIMGGVDTGWYFYTPYSTLYTNSYVFVAAMAVFINGFSTILTALNFVVTIHRLRAPGMTWMRLPLFVWAIYAVSVVMLTATPVLAMDLSAAGDRAHSSMSACSIRRAAATRCCGSTCSGSTRIPPSTS